MARRIRIEYPTAAEALADRLGQGGWYFVQEVTGTCFWYSVPGYTSTQVLMDAPGNGTVASWGGTANLVTS